MAQFPKGQNYGYSSEYNPLLIVFTKIINELKELKKKADELENEIEIAEEESVTLPKTEKDREAYKIYIDELTKKLNEIVSRINYLGDKKELVRLRMAQIVSIHKLKNFNLDEQEKELEKINLETLKQLENELIKKIGIPDLPKVQPWVVAKPKKPPVPPANTNVGYIPEPEPSNTNLPPGQPWISAKPKKPPVPPANTNVGYIPEPEPSNTNLPPGQPKGPPPPPSIGMGIIRNSWILFMKRNKGRFHSLRELSRKYHNQRYRFF
jgi:uncharacterized protein YwgA